jgi:hypothetical protein
MASHFGMAAAMSLLRMFGYASHESQHSSRELADRLLETEAKRSLLQSGFSIAQQTQLDEKIRAIGRSLADGALANDDAAVHSELLFHQTMRELDPPHFRLLERMSLSPAENGLGGEVVGSSYNRTQIETIAPESVPALDTLIARLDGNGLIRNVSEPRSAIAGGVPEPSWAVTEYGRFTLDRLKAVGN